MLRDRGDFDKAETLFRWAAEAGDDDAANNLAGLLAERGDLDEAEKLFRGVAKPVTPPGPTTSGFSGTRANDAGGVAAEGSSRRPAAHPSTSRAGGGSSPLVVPIVLGSSTAPPGNYPRPPKDHLWNNPYPGSSSDNKLL
ncbi:tetratricopeptide repeat protein [Streptomyces collinus]|uniref:tetratricopeptide repeat protein n=1 Tax=Streptomyces collinus TaxID=42684 RepID=UPI00365CD62B